MGVPKRQRDARTTSYGAPVVWSDSPDAICLAGGVESLLLSDGDPRDRRGGVGVDQIRYSETAPVSVGSAWLACAECVLADKAARLHIRRPPSGGIAALGGVRLFLGTLVMD